MADLDYNYALAVLSNIRTVITADTDTELEAIDASLDSIESFTTPLPVVVKFPAVYVEWAGSKLKKSDDESYCDQEHEFQIGVAVIDSDHHAIAVKVLQYVTAVNRAIDKMTQADLLTATSTTLSGAAWEVVDHDSSRGLRINDAGVYRRDAYLTLIVQFRESKG